MNNIDSQVGRVTLTARLIHARWPSRFARSMCFIFVLSVPVATSNKGAEKNADVLRVRTYEKMSIV